MKQWLASVAAVLFSWFCRMGSYLRFSRKGLKPGRYYRLAGHGQGASDYNKTHKDERSGQFHVWWHATVTINKITTGNHVLVLDKILGAGAAPASYC